MDIEEFVSFGLNLEPQDGQEWEDKVKEFADVVEKNGVARAVWSCTGRTRHEMHSRQLARSLPQYEFEIGYDSYLCIARKK